MHASPDPLGCGCDHAADAEGAVQNGAELPPRIAPERRMGHLTPAASVEASIEQSGPPGTTDIASLLKAAT